ncbi:MAG: PilT/PilU family type 4a pilus ATPase [Roseburia sp.]|nr:PilT/PilU family type 4a pilus ATPase [Roseburia sp.]
MAQSVGEILAAAKKERASDVLIAVGIPPKMRINGDLRTMRGERMQPADTMEMAIHIMNDKQKQYFEEHGEVEFSLEILGGGRGRANVYKQKGSIALAFRLVDAAVPSLEQLGMPEIIARLCGRRSGLILVTGPAGSGKSATLAAMIDRINSDREAHILTLEEPIEYFHQHKQSVVTQREIGVDSISYQSALKAARHENPDVLLIDALRDIETLDAAVEAAEAGRLVLSALETVGAANTVERMIEMVLPYQQHPLRMQLANVLAAVISQQLVPAADGKERIAALEIMYANAAVRKVIREGKPALLAGVIQAGRKSGMITMDESLLGLVRENRITRQTAVAYAQEPELMSAKFTKRE